MATVPPTTIRARALPTPFDDVPRRWWGEDAVATQLVNGLTLVFPAGERFFIRAVLHYRSQIQDPQLQAEISGFAGQEGLHSLAHERFFVVMETQGYRIRGFLRFYEGLAYGMYERLAPPPLNLAVTAALEHFTATYAERVLEGKLLAAAHPAMQELLYWHASEEIEHKNVTFDVLQRVNPGYALRIAGLALAVGMLSGFWLIATLVLLRQDRQFGPVRRTALGTAVGRLAIGVLLSGTREYLRRDFHPNQRDTSGLAASYLRSVGMA